MKRKAGDMVRIRSFERMEAQKKDDDGNIRSPEGYVVPLMLDMQSCAGKSSSIIEVHKGWQ
jgi:hypothetical protein